MRLVRGHCFWENTGDSSISSFSKGLTSLTPLLGMYYLFDIITSHNFVLRNLEHELDGARCALEEESAGRENTLRLVAKAEGEAQCWRQKYETDAVAKGEELEMTKMKLVLFSFKPVLLLAHPFMLNFRLRG